MVCMLMLASALCSMARLSIFRFKLYVHQPRKVYIIIVWSTTLLKKTCVILEMLLFIFFRSTLACGTHSQAMYCWCLQIGSIFICINWFFLPFFLLTSLMYSFFSGAVILLFFSLLVWALFCYVNLEKSEHVFVHLTQFGTIFYILNLLCARIDDYEKSQYL